MATLQLVGDFLAKLFVRWSRKDDADVQGVGSEYSQQA